MKKCMILLGLMGGLLVSSSSASTVSGRVIDENGVGVGGVNIDFRDQNGNDVTIFNDSTDGSGNFAVIAPNGVFDIYFRPPPATRFVAQTLFDVNVPGDIDLGNVLMPHGFFLSGIVQNGSGAPLDSVDLDIELNATGERLFTPGDDTDSSGFYRIALSPGVYDVFYDPSSNGTGTYAGDWIEALTISGDTTRNITLVPGNVVTGTVRDQQGVAVANVDLDVDDASTGDRIYTPGDNTDPNGLFQVVVPDGTFHVTFEPPFATHLVARRIENVTITADQSLGTIVLEPGVVLASRVLLDGVGVEHVDLDVIDVQTGQEIPTPGDDTDAAGFASVIVPSGFYRVLFTPMATSGLPPVESVPFRITTAGGIRVFYRSSGTPIVSILAK